MKEISLHIMDLVQNSIRAKASVIEISVCESIKHNLLSLEIHDNGSGMAKEVLVKATDPFFTSRTTRHVGLGIPLYKQLVEQCNGWFSLSSEENMGTSVKSTMALDHIDRQPMGDISGVLILLLAANPQIRFIYTHATETGNYAFDTSEIKSTLEVNSISDPGILKFIKEMIQENLNDIQAIC